MTVEIFDVAGGMEPASLRSLDTLHLAAAQALGDDLAGMVVYDERLRAAATEVGIVVVAPGIALARRGGTPEQGAPSAYL